MSLTKDDLDHVVNLAHLTIKEEKKDLYLSQLQDILDHIQDLDTLDLSTVEPSSYAIEQEQTLRDDKVVEYGDLNLEKNAPKWEDNSFNVPQILKR